MVCFLHFLKRLHQESEEGDLAGTMASYQTDIFNGKNLRDGDSDLKHRQSSLYSMLLNCEISNIRGMFRRAQNCFAISFQAFNAFNQNENQNS